MGRAARYSEDGMLDAAAALLVDGGPPALTAVGVARRLGAPSGSVYHRFRSRDDLAAALWMRTVERFDQEVVEGLRDEGEPVEVAVAVVERFFAWTSSHPVDARVLTRYRREDLTGADAPPELARRAAALGRRQRDAVKQLARRLDQPTELVWLAVAGLPMAAIRDHIERALPIPSWTATAVERAVRALLAQPARPRPEPTDEGAHRA